MKTSLIAFVFFCVLSCGVATHQAQSNDQKNIQGVWLAQTESLNGITKEVSFLYAFKGDKLTFTDETGKAVTYSFKLDTSGNLKLMNLLPEGAPVNSKPVSVAYVLKGNALTIVIAPEGLLPTEISDKNNQELIICKRRD